MAQKCLGRREARFFYKFLLQLDFFFHFSLPQLKTFQSFLQALLQADVPGGIAGESSSLSFPTFQWTVA